jgi:hypothetical protein
MYGNFSTSYDDSVTDSAAYAGRPSSSSGSLSSSTPTPSVSSSQAPFSTDAPFIFTVNNHSDMKDTIFSLVGLVLAMMIIAIGLLLIRKRRTLRRTTADIELGIFLSKRKTLLFETLGLSSVQESLLFNHPQ